MKEEKEEKEKEKKDNKPQHNMNIYTKEGSPVLNFF